MDTILTIPTANSSSFIDDLLSFIDEQEVDELAINLEDEGFSITSPEQANYYVGRLNAVRQEMDQIKATASQAIAKYHDKVNSFLERSISPLESQEERMLILLRYFAEKRLEGSDKRSMKLIEGTLQFRKLGDKYEYDEDKLLTSVSTNYRQYIKTKESVDKTELKKAGKVKDNLFYIGDALVDGITVTPQPDNFDVKNEVKKVQ